MSSSTGFFEKFSCNTLALQTNVLYVVFRDVHSSKPFEILIVKVKSSARFGEEILRSTG